MGRGGHGSPARAGEGPPGAGAEAPPALARTAPAHTPRAPAGLSLPQPPPPPGADRRRHLRLPTGFTRFVQISVIHMQPSPFLPGSYIACTIIIYFLVLTTDFHFNFKYFKRKLCMANNGKPTLLDLKVSPVIRE